MTDAAPDLARPRAIHLVGIGGAGISAIGIILASMGHRVTGVDLNETPAWGPLRAAGIEPEVTSRDELFASAATHEAEFVAHSTAFPPSETERVTAAAAGRAVLDRAAILALICAARRTVAVSGTHGKTSTTAMLATLLDGVGADPSFLVGATPLGLGEAARWTSDGVFVVEADESDGTFLHLGGDVAVITNIDEDHLDFWRDLDAIEAGFDQFVADAASAVICIDDPRLDGATDARAQRVAAAHGATTVGESPSARLQVHSVQVERLETRFGLRLDGTEIGPVSVGTPGRHHARNAAVSIAVALELGVEAADAVAALAAYCGVSRRFEVLGTAGGAVVVDDYAHNPGKVRALLGAADEAGWDRVVAIFQPHRYTRTRDQLEDFGAALALADVVVVTEVYAAGEAPIDGVDGQAVVASILRADPSAEVVWTPTLDDAEVWAREHLAPGDLCLCVGAGDVFRVGRSLVATA